MRGGRAGGHITSHTTQTHTRNMSHHVTPTHRNTWSWRGVAYLPVSSPRSRSHSLTRTLINLFPSVLVARGHPDTPMDSVTFLLLYLFFFFFLIFFSFPLPPHIYRFRDLHSFIFPPLPSLSSIDKFSDALLILSFLSLLCFPLLSFPPSTTD